MRLKVVEKHNHPCQLARHLMIMYMNRVPISGYNEKVKITSAKIR